MYIYIYINIDIYIDIDMLIVVARNQRISPSHFSFAGGIRQRLREVRRSGDGSFTSW